MTSLSRLSLCFLLAILTLLSLLVASAWIRARSPQTFSSRVLRSSDPRPEWLWTPPQGWPPSADLLSSSETFGYRHRIAATVTTPTPGSDQAQHLQEEVAICLPFPCLVHRSDSASRVWSSRVSGLFTLSDLGDAVIVSPGKAPGATSGGMAIIPLTPSWPGLIADVLLLTILWASILIVPFEIHRGRRLAAGRCAKCGYDLKGLTLCPECGAVPPAPPPAPLPLHP